MPSNLAVEKFGASRWIARIMVTLGIISAAMPARGVFYILRFLLGVAEAGFFPGLGFSGLVTDPTVNMIALIVAAIGIFCTLWTLPTAWLSGCRGRHRADQIDGNLAGFGGPYLIGWVKDTTGSTQTELLVFALLLPLIGGPLVFLGGDETKGEFANR